MYNKAMRLQILNIESIQIMATQEDFSALSLNVKLLSIIYEEKNIRSNKSRYCAPYVTEKDDYCSQSTHLHIND